MIHWKPAKRVVAVASQLTFQAWEEGAIAMLTQAKSSLIYHHSQNAWPNDSFDEIKWASVPTSLLTFIYVVSYFCLLRNRFQTDSFQAMG